MWALWCAGCITDGAWRAGLSQQEPNKAWVRVGVLKLLHAAWEEATSVWTQPPCSWTGRGLTPGPQASTLDS